MEHHFDDVAKALAEGVSRREALRRICLGLAGMKQFPLLLALITALTLGVVPRAHATDGFMAGGGEAGIRPAGPHDALWTGPFSVNIQQQGTQVQGSLRAHVVNPNDREQWFDWQFQATGGDLLTVVTGVVVITNRDGGYLTELTEPGELEYSPTGGYFGKGSFHIDLPAIGGLTGFVIVNGHVTVQTQ
jgi:hypothetical protein